MTDIDLLRLNIDMLELEVMLKHLPGQHDQSTHGHGSGITSGRKQPEVTGNHELSIKANDIIDRLPDALVPPYKSISIEKSSGISHTNNNKVMIGDMPGMDSDSVIEHEILHTVAPKYKSDYPKSVSDAGRGKWSESAIDYSEPSQRVTEDFVASSHAYLSETRGFNGPTFEDAKRSGMLNDSQINARRGYFKGLIGD